MPEVKTQTKPAGQTAQPEMSSGQSKGAVTLVTPPRLPYIEEVGQRYGIDKSGWYALVGSVFPGAKTVGAVVLALAYCKARRLDVFKRVVHIVSIWDSKARDGKGGYVESVWPGIAELRTTAHRTSQYAGCDPTVFGPTIEHTFEDEIGKEGSKRVEKVTVRFPEWAQITVYRMLQGKRVAFPGPRVVWLETYATIGKSILPNEMWRKRSSGQLEKCAEAAALRKACPEELGNDIAFEELREVESLDKDKIPPRPTKASVERELAEAADVQEAAAQADARAAEPTEERTGPRKATPAAEDPEEASQASPQGETRHDPETGEVDDGFAVIGFDDSVVWGPRDDGAEYVAQLCKLLKKAASIEVMMAIYSKNTPDIKKLSQDEKDLINTAMKEFVVGQQ